MIHTFTRHLPAATVLLGTLLASGAQANIIYPPHNPPLPGSAWIDTDSHSHNHNTNVQWNMENIRRQPAPQYDAYGSWFYLENEALAAMTFHWSNTPSGRDQTDGVYFGHGYIPSARPLEYYYQNVPANNLDIIDVGFELWEKEINTNPLVFRKPGTHVGFSWEQTTVLADRDILVTWEDLAGTSRGSIGQWSMGTRSIQFDSNPEMYGSEYWVDINHDNIFQAGTDTLYDTNGNSVWDGSEPYTDANDNGAWDIGEAYEDWNSNGSYTDDSLWIPLTWQVAASGQVDVYELDLLTIALHEIGHAVGLDDLYNLNRGGEDRYPDSLMGTGARPYWFIGGDSYEDPGQGGVDPALPRRGIDLGSIQGGVDLYTIPEPNILLLVGLGLAAMTLRPRRAGQVA